MLSNSPLAPSTTHLLYLHGFRSSPDSAKARRMAALVRQRFPKVSWLCPQLPPSPSDAIHGLLDEISNWPGAASFKGMAVVGSSLGGFYATWIAEKFGCKAVVLNPAVNPARDLTRHIGLQTVWQNPDDSFFFKAEYIDQLRALEAGPLAVPARYMAVIAKGDEVLDWREMSARYAGADIRLLEGGDHGLADFDEHVPSILEFLDLKT